MPTASRHPDTALAVFLAFLKLGCSAFGGPSPTSAISATSSSAAAAG